MYKFKDGTIIDGVKIDNIIIKLELYKNVRTAEYQVLYIYKFNLRALL